MNKQKEFIEMDMEYPRSGVTHAYQIDKDEHHKTYAEDFFEKYPNAPFKSVTGIPCACRGVIYGGGSLCTLTAGNCVTCWNAEMEGEE